MISPITPISVSHYLSSRSRECKDIKEQKRRKSQSSPQLEQKAKDIDKRIYFLEQKLELSSRLGTDLTYRHLNALSLKYV